MKVKTIRAGMTALAAAGTALLATAAHAQSDAFACNELQKLVEAALEDGPFSSLSPAIARGQRLGSYRPDSSLGVMESRSCSITKVGPVSARISCPLEMPSSTEAGTGYQRIRSAQVELAKRFGACPLLSGNEKEAKEIQTSRWSLADGQAEVIIATRRARTRRPPIWVGLQVIRVK